MDFESKMKLAVEMAHYRIEIAKQVSSVGAAASIRSLLDQPLPSNTLGHTDDYTCTVHTMFSLIEQLEHDYKLRHKSD